VLENTISDGSQIKKPGGGSGNGHG
jgi:hypothetical protein